MGLDKKHFNSYGKVKREVIERFGIPYLTEKGELLTYSELKKKLWEEFRVKVDWDYEQRIKTSGIWLCSQKNRGCSPLYILEEVYIKLRDNQYDI